LLLGQKTGWFYDQRDNRSRFLRYVKPNDRVLDVCSYIGGWSVRAALAGAKVSAIDTSEPALQALGDNAEANGVDVELLHGDALEVLKHLKSEGAKFEAIVVDPPALIKRQKDFEVGLEHYAALNRAAMQLLVSGGFLVSCSCSQALGVEDLQRVLLRNSRQLKRPLQLLEQSFHAPDHPVHPAIPESQYLKALFMRVL
jgi:23S rRNA (cytosine1962-C5)-methyltransferase